MTFQTISGATGAVCSESGLYKTTDKRAQYVELYTVGDVFRNFPGGRGTKTATWYLITGTTTGAVSDTNGVVTTPDDGGFTSVVVAPGSA